MTPEELLHEAMRAPRRALVTTARTRVIDRPGWFQLITPSVRDGPLNEVAEARLAPESADAVIDATVAEYRALGVAFRWTVDPDSAPADLAARLAARGLEATWSRAMLRDTTPAIPSDATVEVVTDATLEEFTHVMAAGWKMDPAPLRALHAEVLADPGRRLEYSLVRAGGRALGAAGASFLPRSVRLLGGVVLPEARGQGLYRALVAHRLERAAAQGIGLATTHAMEHSSAPILERLGFRTLCRFPVYRFTPRP